MKNVGSKYWTLVSITRGVVVLFVVSIIVGGFVLCRVPNPAKATETSECATPLVPREKMLYVLSQSYSERTLHLFAIDTNGQQHWTQEFATLSALPSRGSLEVKNGIVYALVTGSAGQSNLNIASAYDANSGKKLWDIQAPANNAVGGMSVCNNIIYLWTETGIYAYSATNGSPLWRSNNLTFATVPHVVVTNNAVVFVSGIGQGGDINHDTIYALDSKKGTQLWKVNIPNRNLNKQLMALSLTANNNVVYVSQFNQGSPQTVEALSSNNGSLLWNASVSMKLGNNFTLSPPLFPSTVVNDNIFYLSADNAGVVALNVSHGTYLWEDSTVLHLQPLLDRLYVTHAKASDFCQLDPITGKSQWCNPSISGVDPVKAVSDQTVVYIPSLTGINAMQKGNGKVNWVYKEKTSGTALMLIYGLSFDY